MRSGAPCASGNLHEENPAPQARKSMQAQPAGPARFYAPPYGGVGAFLWEAVRFIVRGIFD